MLIIQSANYVHVGFSLALRELGQLNINRKKKGEGEQ